MSFDEQKLKSALTTLAGNEVFIGTSSWKYPGWRGMIYDESRYITRGKFSVSRFERDCLAEYAETFGSVKGSRTRYAVNRGRIVGVALRLADKVRKR